MATAAIILASTIATTTAQASVPGLGTMPATAAPSTSIIAATGTYDPMLKASTALQAPSFQDAKQFGGTLKTLNIAGEKKVGDVKKATTIGLWAAVPNTAYGQYGTQMQARDFDLKGVAVINRAKHPAISKFVPRQVLYVC